MNASSVGRSDAIRRKGASHPFAVTKSSYRKGEEGEFVCRHCNCTEMANKDGAWLREMSSCCCLTTAGKTSQLLLNKIYIPFLPSL